MKRSYDELRQESDKIDEEIDQLNKKQRVLEEEIKAHPDADRREEEVVAKARAERQVRDRAFIDTTLPPALAKVLLDDAARQAWPDLGSLIQLEMEVDTINVTRLNRADIVRVHMQFEKGPRFEGIVLTDSGNTVPSVTWDPSDMGEYAADFKQDPWKRAFEWNTGRDPVRALFALLVHGIMKLEDTDDALVDSDKEEEAMRKVWAQIYPPVQKGQEGHEVKED